MMSPDGEVGEIPDESLQAAQDAGYRVMTDEDMRIMFNKIAMADRIFQRDWKKKHRPICRPLRYLRT